MTYAIDTREDKIGFEAAVVFENLTEAELDAVHRSTKHFPRPHLTQFYAS